MCSVIPFEADDPEDLIACVKGGDCIHLDQSGAIFTKPEEDRIAYRVSQAYKAIRQKLKKERTCNSSASPSI